MVIRDEYNNKYPGIFRLAVKLTYKPALYSWINAILPEKLHLKTTHPELGGVYLLTICDYPNKFEKMLKIYYLEIFKHELYNFQRDDKTWPKNLSWKNFKNFFSYSFASRIVDLELENPIYDDENE
jgi:hypothetical protein